MYESIKTSLPTANNYMLFGARTSRNYILNNTGYINKVYTKASAWTDTKANETSKYLTLKYRSGQSLDNVIDTYYDYFLCSHNKHNLNNDNIAMMYTIYYHSVNYNKISYVNSITFNNFPETYNTFHYLTTAITDINLNE